MAKVKASARYATDADEADKPTKQKGKKMSTGTETNLSNKAVTGTATGTATGSADQDEILRGLVGQVVELLPEDIVVDEKLNVRQWEGNGKKEQERVAELATAIKEEGQLQDGGVFPVFTDAGDVEYHLFMGGRRRNAVALINAEKAAGEDPTYYRARVFHPEEVKKLRRKAIMENLKRKGFSAMDVALNIKTVAEENGWNGADRTKHLANYFGRSRAWVSQHEKLLALPPDVQAKIGEMGMESDPAQFLAAETDTAKAPETLKRAQEIAEKQAPKPKTEGKTEGNGKTPKPVTTKSGAKEKEKPKVEKKHLVQAARETGSLKETKPRAKSELVAFFQEIADSPAYGHENSPAREFCRYFVDKFASGAVETDRGAFQKFDSMIFNEDGELLCGEGTPSKAEMARREEEDANAKAKAKAAGAAKAAPKAKAKTKAA